MATSIEWCEETWNPTTGCTRVSAGCDHCYAVQQSYRVEKLALGRGDARTAARYEGLTVINGSGARHFNGVVRCHEDRLDIPLRWRKPRRIFVNSMSDLFHEGVPFEFIDKVFAVMASSPQHDFLVLTKRPGSASAYAITRTRTAIDDSGRVDRMPQWYQQLTSWLDDGDVGFLGKNWSRCHFAAEQLRPSDVLPNVWLGTSIESFDQIHRMDWLLNFPAAVRFLSLEPLLGPITIPQCALHNLHWVIVGGESGPGARPCNVDWIRSIVAQCREANVPVFVKQLGAHPCEPNRHNGQSYHHTHGDLLCKKLSSKKGGDPDEWPSDLRVREMPEREASFVKRNRPEHLTLTTEY